MKREFTLEIDGQQVTVTAVREGEVIRVSRGEEEYAVRILGESVPGVQEGGRGPTGAGGPAARAEIRRPVSVAAPAGTGDQTGGAPPEGAGTVVSPMTGVVDQVSVAEGERVAEGQVVLVLEAMKMFIDVMAPEPGTVASVQVQPGDSVREGQALVTISAGAG